MHKNGNNANIGVEALLCENKKSSEKCYYNGNRTQTSYNLLFQVQHSPFWTKLTFACKTETLVSLYNHVLLILTESSESKNQVVHEQKFKDLLSSSCQVSPERRVLESEVMWGLGSITPLFTGLFCFHIVKPLMLILALLPTLYNYEKPRMWWAIHEVMRFFS